MKKAITAVVLMMFFGGAAVASSMDGHQLLTKCTSQKYFENGECSGVISGVIDLAGDLSRAGVTEETFCIPARGGRGKVEVVVLQYLRDHPEQLGQTASSLVLRSLQESYPCSKEAS